MRKVVLIILAAAIFAGAQDKRKRPKTLSPNEPTRSAVSPTNAGPDLNVYAGETVRLGGSTTVGTPKSLHWTTGDGYTIDSILKAPHTYMVPGTFIAQLTVTGADGVQYSDTANVTVKAIGAADSITIRDSGDPEINKQNLTAALRAAAVNPNENEIVVPAGMVINDTIYMPARSKIFGTYVTVRSSRSDELPVGERVTKTDRPKMFRILAQSPGSPGGVENCAISISEGTNYFRFVGMDIVRSGAADRLKNDIVFVNYASGSTLRPSHMIFDRILIDGNGTDVIRAFAPNGDTFSLLNSSIYDIKATWNESKAIGMWSGKGNLAVINNYLEAASINTLLGGAYTDPSNMIDGVVFRGNDSYKKPEWVIADGVGRGYAVKNLFELKAAVNVVAESNTFENNWVDAQSGPSILFTVRGSGQPLNTVSNISFRNNVVKNVHSGVNILPSDDESPSAEIQNVYIEHNQFIGMKDRALILLPQPTGTGRNIHYKHNTVRMSAGAGTVIVMDGADGMQIFIESNDFGYIGEYGVFGSGLGEGVVSLQGYLSTDSTFKRNLISFAGRSYPINLNTALQTYPADTYFSFIDSDSYNLDGTPYGYIVGTDGRTVGH